MVVIPKDWIVISSDWIAIPKDRIVISIDWIVISSEVEKSVIVPSFSVTK